MTPFEVVYKVFFKKMIDSSFIEAPEEVAKDELVNLLNSAIFCFEYPKISLENDQVAETFNETLGNDEIQLLAYLMTFEWFKNNLLNVSIFTKDMTTSEFKSFSRGNKLTALEKTGVFISKEIEHKKQIYHMRTANKTGFSKLGGK